MKRRFPVRERTSDSITGAGRWLSRGWRAFRSNPLPFIIGSLIIHIWSIFPFIQLYIRSLFHPILIFPFLILIFPLIMAGWANLSLRLTRGEKASGLSVLRAFSPDYIVRAWVTGVLYFLIVCSGTVLLIIPGIIWALKFGFGIYAVMDRRISATGAIKYSGQITKGHLGPLFMIILTLTPIHFFNYLLDRLLDKGEFTLIAINIAFKLLFISIIIPWISAALASAYDDLSHRKKVLDAEAPPQNG